MWKAVIAKELREVSGIAAVALFLHLVLVAMLILMPSKLPQLAWQPQRTPFLGDGFPAFAGCIAALLALALGFRQSFGESLAGTYPKLLGLPISREAVFAAKLVAGLGIYFGCSLLPILLYAAWAATPGTHASPFLWSMTDMSFRLYLSMPLVYLAAFLSGIRPARFLGTRLIPLAGTAGLGLAIQFVPWWWQCGTVALLVTGLALVTCIFHAARSRDY